MSRRRPGLIAGSILLAALMLPGCADSDAGSAPQMGADLSKVGPSPLPSAPPVPALTSPAATAEPEEDTPVKPTLPAALATFEKAVTAALQPTDVGAAASLELELRASAQDQLVITWTATMADVKDPGELVRKESRTVLAQARKIDMKIGSVLLIVHGAARTENNVDSISQLVRAKYSERLVKGTNWNSVAVSKVFDLVDDKAAELHPSVRS